MAAQCLADEARETVILVPAQASFCGIAAHEAVPCGGLFTAGGIGVLKSSPRGCSPAAAAGRFRRWIRQACACWPRRPSTQSGEEMRSRRQKGRELHVKVAELVSAMKMENISPEDLAGLAKGHPAGKAPWILPFSIQEMQDRRAGRDDGCAGFGGLCRRSHRKRGIFCGQNCAGARFRPVSRAAHADAVTYRQAAEDIRITFEAEEESPVLRNRTPTGGSWPD